MSIKRIRARLETLGLKLEAERDRVEALHDRVEDELAAVGEIELPSRSTSEAHRALHLAEDALRKLSWDIAGLRAGLDDAGWAVDAIVDHLDDVITRP